MKVIAVIVVAVLLPLTLVCSCVASIELFANKGRFSLSWLLIVTTLVAVALGAIMALN